MKMNKGIILAGLVGTSFTIPGLVMKKSAPVANKPVQSAISLAEAFAGTDAGGKPTDACHDAFDAVMKDQPKRGVYTHSILDHLHMELYRANKIETADVEMIFCRLINVMGIDPDTSTLTEAGTDISKTDPRGNTITATVSKPSESWATTAGYTAKVAIKSGDTVFMTMWWAGSGDSSKGYLIQGSNPMQTDTMKRLRYAMWDKTTADQTVKIFATQFATTFLGTTTAPTNAKGPAGDNAHFARVSFNTGTSKVTAQSVEIRPGRATAESSTFKCVRTYFTGTIGGSIDGYRPAKGVEEVVTETSKGGSPTTDGTQAAGCNDGTAGTANCGLDGETVITDATTTADHSGTASAGSNLASGTFDWSCSNLNGAGGTGKPFASNTVDFTTAPSTVFP